ncbi:metal ABC transporter permease [Roseateles sp. BYS180W]|uniref:Metal ABC transporter permease n=1 Tax=Roseateles rivi TaxID=3299028 RepID=A0ABW7FQM4_9BURK
MSLDTLLLDAWFMLPLLALLCGVLALAPLGAQVLARGVVFIDLAVAQAAAAAALWVGAAMEHADWLTTHGLAVAGALACAGVVAWVSRRWPAQREALIGLLYVAGASIALLGARQDPHGRERMAELLAADVLWAHTPQVAVLAGCAALVLLLGRRLTRDVVFFPVFAVVTSLAVPVLGLFLVFATLIAPALWQRSGVAPWRAWGGAVLACALGLGASWAWDAPSGACVALALASYGALSALRHSARLSEPPATGPG